MRTVYTETGGEYVVYHVSEAGNPDAHDTSRGEWFWQPCDVLDGEVWSLGYPTEEAAIAAARDGSDG